MHMCVSILLVLVIWKTLTKILTEQGFKTLLDTVMHQFPNVSYVHIRFKSSDLHYFLKTSKLGIYEDHRSS
jgi:hypothetical protein